MSVIRGNRNPSFVFAESNDFGEELRSVGFDEGEGEATTFYEFSVGYRPVAVTLTFDLSFDADSAYNYFFTNAGSSNVEWEYVIDGEAAVSASNPRFFGTCTLPPKPLFELEASTEKQSFEIEVQLDSFDKASTAG